MRDRAGTQTSHNRLGRAGDRVRYFDQSHLMRDFVAFSGVSPADYKRRQTKLDRAGIHVKRHHLPLFE